jgi:glyoxylase-like metal-dependent hydrolase (beta-lactamase superfamily II)
MPEAGVRGGAETLLPEWKPGAKPLPARPGANGGFKPEDQPQHLAAGEVKAVHVQGNVHMIVGAGANIAVQAGEDGVLVVDTGNPGSSDKVLAAIKQIAPGKEIRWVVNTGMSPDHTGGNESVSKAGRTVNGNIAAIVSHENTAARMVKAGVADSARPFNTYFEPSRDFPFNGEPIMLFHDDATADDTGTVVMFRRSDVIATGDLFRTEGYPVIDLANGGSIDGTIAGLNRLLDLTVPSKMLEEGGTYVIPGHGRISDEHDVAMYRDMLVIIRDRIKNMVQKKMTLDQVKAARPTLDYDGRYGADTGPWTTAMFIEAVYREMSSPANSASQRSAR